MYHEEIGIQRLSFKKVADRVMSKLIHIRKNYIIINMSYKI